MVAPPPVASLSGVPRAAPAKSRSESPPARHIGVVHEECHLASTTPRPAQAPNANGKFSISEDWLAFTVGLVLLALCLTGIIPEGLIP